MRNPFDNMREGITLRVVIGHEGGMNALSIPSRTFSPLKESSERLEQA
jgi:hypothetical protein